MVNLDIPIPAPHPHLNWSATHKHRAEMEHKNRLDNLEFSRRFREVQESHRLYRIRQYREETESIHQYQVLERNRAFGQYKYLYYLGTQIDVYI